MEHRFKCLQCNKEMEDLGRFTTCGCPNVMSYYNGKVTAMDLEMVVEVAIPQRTPEVHKPSSYLKPEDLQYQEQRKQRKVRRLQYDVR